MPIIEGLHSISDIELVGYLEDPRRQTDCTRPMFTQGVNKLSPEILLHVFSLLPPGPSDHSLAAAASVCRRWKEICLDSSCLWATLVIGDPQHPRDVDAVYLWLQRSHDVSIRLYFTVSRADSSVYGSRVLAALCSHSDRWETLHCQIPSNASLEYPIVRAKFAPNIKHFSLSWGSRLPLSSTAWVFWHRVWRTPGIETFECNDLLPLTELIRNRVSDSDFVIPGVFRTLRVLRATVVANNTFFDLLRTCGSLSELDVHILNSAPGTPLVLPVIGRLTICGDKISVSTVLGRLTTPSLSELTVSVDTNVLEALNSLLERSACNLAVLDAPLVGITDAEFALFMAHSRGCLRHLLVWKTEIALRPSTGSAQVRLERYCEPDYYLPDLKDATLIMPTNIRAGILDILNCPSLARLDLGSYHHDIPSLVRFFERSSCYPQVFLFSLDAGHIRESWTVLLSSPHLSQLRSLTVSMVVLDSFLKLLSDLAQQRTFIFTKLEVMFLRGRLYNKGLIGGVEGRSQGRLTVRYCEI